MVYSTNFCDFGWTAAEAIDLPIIPVFYDVDHIPTLLKSRLGIEYDFYDFD